MRIAVAILLGAVGVGIYLYVADPSAEKSHASSPHATGTSTRAYTDTRLPTSPVGGREADGSETVLGLRVRADRNCTVRQRAYVATDGTPFIAYTCEPTSPRAPHPYAHYDNASLAALAYGDAVAAALLGERLIGRDRERSHELLLRAAALDGGNVRYLAWLAEQAFGTVEIDGVPQLSNIMRQYELAALAERLGDTSAKSDFLRSELGRLGVSDEQLTRLDDRVTNLLQAMRDIQQLVHGEITLGGTSDA